MPEGTLLPMEWGGPVVQGGCGAYERGRGAREEPAVLIRGPRCLVVIGGSGGPMECSCRF